MNKLYPYYQSCREVLALLVREETRNLPRFTRREFFIVLAVFAVVLLASTYQDIFFLKTLYLDDHHRYVLGLENQPHEIIIARNVARAYVVFPLYKLLSIDPALARLALVLVFMAPLAATVYFCLRHYAGLGKLPSFFAALLPNILPAQTQIPYFIDGSYTVQGLLVYLLSLIATIEFIKREKASPVLFATAIIVYYLSISMMDHAIFMIPFTGIVVLMLNGMLNNFCRKFMIMTFLGAIALYKAWATSQLSISPTVLPTWDFFLSRLEGFLHVALPYAYRPYSTPRDVALMALAFICIYSFSLGLGNAKERLLLIGAGAWIIVSSIVFVTITEWYQPRYAYIAGYGFNFVLVYSAFIMMSKLPVKDYGRYALAATLVISLTLFSEFHRFNNMRDLIARDNPAFETVQAELRDKPFPPDSQIVIIQRPYKIITGGYHWYSSGFMKYVTGRRDVTGQIGDPRNFYNPYGVEKRVFVIDHKMNGLDIEQPIFFYKLNCSPDCEISSRSHALQWRDDGWSLFHYDSVSGEILIEYTGTDFSEYLAQIAALGITQEDVMFGDGTP